MNEKKGQRLQLYSQLPKGLQKLYSSEESSTFHGRIISRYSIERDADYIDVVGDTILGIHSVPSLTERLVAEVGVSNEVARKITADLIEFLKPLSEQPERSGDQTQSKQEPESKSVIDPMRTMQEDVDRIHGYGAYRELYPDAPSDEEPVHRTSQEAVLGRTQVAETPRYEIEIETKE